MRTLRSFCLALLLLVLSALPCLGAGFPSLSGPAVYVGEFKQENDAYTVQLVLTREGKFLLEEALLLPNGKHSGWAAAGDWKQAGGGAFLVLSNKHNFSREINVGGFGNLYLSMQMPTVGLVTVTLRHKERAPQDEELARIADLEKAKLGEGGGTRLLAVASEIAPSPDKAEKNGTVVEKAKPQRKSRDSFELAHAPVFQKSSMKPSKTWNTPAAQKKDEDTPALSADARPQVHMLAAFEDGEKDLSQGPERTESEPAPSGKDTERQLVVAVPEQFRKNAATFAAPWQQTYMLASVTEQGGGKKASRGKTKKPAKLFAEASERAGDENKPSHIWKQRYMLASVSGFGVKNAAGEADSLKQKNLPQRITGMTASNKEFRLSQPWRQTYLLAYLPVTNSGKQSAPALSAPSRKETLPASVKAVGTSKNMDSPTLLRQHSYTLAGFSSPAAGKALFSGTSTPATPVAEKTEPIAALRTDVSSLLWQRVYLPSVTLPKQEKQTAREKRPVKRHVGELHILPGGKLFECNGIKSAGRLRDKEAAWTLATNVLDFKSENRAPIVPGRHR